MADRKTQLVTLIFEPVAGKTDAIALDVTEDETPEVQIDATENPLETGAFASDHAHIKPIGLRLSGKVVDFPLKTAPLPTTGIAVPAHEGRANETYERLLQLAQARTVFEIHGRIRVYRNMLLVSVGGTRRSGTMINLSLAFREVRFADSQTVAIPKTKKPRQKPVQFTGTKAGAVATQAEVNRSFLVDFGATLTGFLGGAPDSFLKAGVH